MGRPKQSFPTVTHLTSNLQGKFFYVQWGQSYSQLRHTLHSSNLVVTTTQGLSTLRSSALTFLKNRPNSCPARLVGESVKWRHPWWVWPGIQSVNLHGLTEPLFTCKHFKSPKSHSFHTAFNLCQAVRQAHSVWSQERWGNHCAGSKGPSESN